jgi:hypothetical protein
VRVRVREREGRGEGWEEEGESDRYSIRKPCRSFGFRYSKLRYERFDRAGDEENAAVIRKLNCTFLPFLLLLYLRSSARLHLQSPKSPKSRESVKKKSRDEAVYVHD